MSATLSTHVLDTSLGTPARGVPVTLDRHTADGWTRIGAGETDDDGRQKTLVPTGEHLLLGTYRLTFDTGAYARSKNTRAFFPEVSIVFEIVDATHHHVPLLLSPFGYSTYRGS
jgi:5-hydroxyisourate hydrolase